MTGACPSTSDSGLGEIHAKFVDKQSTIIGRRSDQNCSANFDQRDGNRYRPKLAIPGPKCEPHKSPD